MISPAHHFLAEVWGEQPPPGLLAISWNGDGGFRTQTFARIHEAAAFGVRAPGDVYVRVCSLRPDFTGGGRGGAADSWALPALALDLDVKPNAFDSLDAARSYLDTLPFAPSLVVESGGGLQPWWVLEEPLLLDTRERRAKGTALADRWRGFCRYQADKVDADLDPVADLARVLRLPGTLSHKYNPPRPVHLSDTGRARYPVARLEAALPPVTQDETPPPGPAHRSTAESCTIPIDRSDPTPEDRAWIEALCQIDPVVRILYTGAWRGGRYDYGAGQNPADAALVGKLLHFGADDGRIQRLFRSSGLNRPKTSTQRPGGDYLTYTIARLRSLGISR